MNNKLNIKLNELNASELDRNEKQKIRGGDMLPGDCCGCGCCWEIEGGGVDSLTNAGANSLQGKNTVFCDIATCGENVGHGGVVEADDCGQGNVVE